MNKQNESICRNCFHSYVCEQFNENKDDSNGKCHFFNDHYVPTADVVPKSEVVDIIKEVDSMIELVSAMVGLDIIAFGKYAQLKKKYTD